MLIQQETCEDRCAYPIHQCKVAEISCYQDKTCCDNMQYSRYDECALKSEHRWYRVQFLAAVEVDVLERIDNVETRNPGKYHSREKYWQPVEGRMHAQIGTYRRQ